MQKMRIYDTIIKPALFSLDPETAHNLVLLAFKNPAFTSALGMLRARECSDERLSQDLLGTRFPNPIGLAAGFDKNVEVVPATAALGFGFTEVGAVTPQPQAGNARPRLFRFPKEECLQNAMGFNNVGMVEAARRLLNIYPSDIPIGVNIGKNKATPPESALRDYMLLVKAFRDRCDYLTINVSSPNTAGLRDLQNEEFIEDVFTAACKLTGKPVLLKVAPDMDLGKMVYLCKAAVDSGASGIIATNTTTDYSLLRGAKGFGGISGPVLAEKSTAALKAIAGELFGETILISVGGIYGGKGAYERICLGAHLAKVFTAFIFKGASMIWDANRDIVTYLRRDGFDNISEAVGSSLS